MHDTHRTNPFQEVYLTEALEDPELYWSWFSPEILSGEVANLYRRGNIVLKGSNGAGKTMLLRLFSPEVQAAYLNHGQPVPSHDGGRYISTGINFIHAGFGALGNRLASNDPEENHRTWPLIVADMLNYFLIFELLRNLRMLSEVPGKRLAEALGVKVDPRTLDAFATTLANHECWFGALGDVTGFDALQSGIRRRLTDYRAYLNMNYDVLPEGIQRTKTAIGEPVTQAKLALDAAGVTKKDVALMVTIDQYETLFHTDYASTPGEIGSLGRSFCRVVNSLLARRDPRVSYKVGVRPYSWDVELRVMGSDARLELGRDYQLVDLDETLRRKENTGAWLFPKFARDVAWRRISRDRSETASAKSLEQQLQSLSPRDELGRYCGSDEQRLLPDDPGWPSAWRRFLQRLYKRDKYDALMAQVWIRQRVGAGKRLPARPPKAELAQWRREWWQKERREAMLMQAASRCKQRRLYGGWDALMSLSGANILVFLSLCREMWDIWERSTDARTSRELKISVEVQSQAIRVVSSSWLAKLNEFSGGPRRRDFVIRLGFGMRNALLEDIGLVYPGRNGFSLLREEYESCQAAEARTFLNDAADFGALLMLPHTTKEKPAKPRFKWYLLPVLCPNFDIPAIRTKEPYYASLSEVQAWVQESGTVRFTPPHSHGRRSRAASESDRQGTIFPDARDGEAEE